MPRMWEHKVRAERVRNKPPASLAVQPDSHALQHQRDPERQLLACRPLKLGAMQRFGAQHTPALEAVQSASIG